jgi:hypothetical protein
MKHTLSSVSLLTLVAGVSVSAQSASTSGFNIPATPNTTQMLALASANPGSASTDADQPAAASKTGKSKPDVVISTGKASKGFWSNWAQTHRRTAPGTAAVHSVNAADPSKNQ